MSRFWNIFIDNEKAGRVLWKIGLIAIRFLSLFLYFQKVQKGKQGTRGAKQIVDENAATLKFYQYMAAGSTAMFFITNCLFFEFTVTVSVRK